MAGVNQIFSLADDVAKYVKSCGKRSILYHEFVKIVE